MKHLLIILSLILLSSLLTSCEKNEETLYRWETSSGYKWKTIGDKNNHPQYKGEVKREYIIFGDYIREGLGILIYPNGEKYVGSWKNGSENGQGTMTFSFGVKHVGEFKDGIMWNGTEYLPNGKIMGKYVNGKEIKQ